jgi:hypothetical protein
MSRRKITTLKIDNIIINATFNINIFSTNNYYDFTVISYVLALVF